MMMGLRKTVAATSVAGASVPLRVCWTGSAPWSLLGGLVWLSVFLMMCVGVFHPLHPGCRCSELSLVLVVHFGFNLVFLL